MTVFGFVCVAKRLIGRDRRAGMGLTMTQDHSAWRFAFCMAGNAKWIGAKDAFGTGDLGLPMLEVERETQSLGA
jgi:hypothetical protein